MTGPKVLNGNPLDLGYMTVLWGDESVHVVDVSSWDGHGPVYRCTPVCGEAGPGVSSDEGWQEWIKPRDVTCTDCLGIMCV